MNTKFYSLVAALILFANLSFAQDKPIGYWRAQLPYNTALGAATDGAKLYVVCGQSFFTLNPGTGETAPYSKVDGMSDVGMQCVGYDMATSTAVLGYQNANIDLFKDNTFYNIPDLKLKNVAATKNINSIYTENGTAYLSTSLGVMVIDLANRVITENYQLNVNNQVSPIFGYTGLGSDFYTITGNGLYRASKSNPELQNFAVWQRLNAHVFNSVAVLGDKLYLADTSRLYELDNDTLRKLYHAPPGYGINHIDAGKDRIWVSENALGNGYGRVEGVQDTLVVAGIFCPGSPRQTVELPDGSLHIADATLGMETVGDSYKISFEYPQGPADPNAFGIYAYNKEVWVAHGGYNDLYVDTYNRFGISHDSDNKWTTYTQYNYPPFGDSVYDFVSIIKDKDGDGTVYAASFRDGLFEIHPDGSSQLIKDNSFLDHSIPNGTDYYQMVGLAFDHEDNLWMTMFGSFHELLVKTKAGDWYKYTVPIVRQYPYAGGQLVIDNDDQKWYVCTYGNGVMVYNDNGTLADASDDTYYRLLAGVGYGNLPSNNVISIACDKSGDIWVGTDNGIGIVSCTGGITQATSTCRDASIPIVQYDQYAGYLFSGEIVRTIAVDGGNRKWIGTDNGVWLLSPDASKIIYRFTSDNSPLPANHIEHITVDDATGDVYIGTDHGMMSYRSTATEGGTANTNVLTFPNPVPSGYNGTIAIKGLVADADVRITDISGQLVYHTTALGGQAVWSGKDYTGRRPQSGVYLIFVTNTDGTQTYSGKMVFMN